MGAGPAVSAPPMSSPRPGCQRPFWKRRRSSVGWHGRSVDRPTYGEFRFDIGGHRWFTKSDELNELFREVIAEELLWVNRTSRIYFDGKYV